MNNIEIKPIKLTSSFLMFFTRGVWFCLIVRVLVPRFSNLTGINAYMVWAIFGTLLLNGPIFFSAVYHAKKDGFLTFNAIKERLMIKRLNRKDVLWIAAGVCIAAVISGLIILVYARLSPGFDINSLKDISPIKVISLVGAQRIFLLFLPVFFFFNYVGEEILWRGYILPRQLVSKYGRYAWAINAIFHCVYHVMTFGIKPLIIMFPFMLLMPYIAYKRQNTTTSIIIHFLLGGPTQIMVAFGLVM